METNNKKDNISIFFDDYKSEEFTEEQKLAIFERKEKMQKFYDKIKAKKLEKTKIFNNILYVLQMSSSNDDMNLEELWKRTN